VLRIALFALVAAALSGCGPQRATPVELCTAILAQKVPAAEVVAVSPQPPDGLDITYAAAAADEARVEGHLVCELERSDLGGPRLRAASLDGRPLSDTELVVVNANLLLDELYWLGRRSG
jgi:hypothetical protein